MEKITVQTFEECPLLKGGYKIVGQKGLSIYISNHDLPAIIGLLTCAGCIYKNNGCSPSMNFFDLHEIEASIDSK